jgi:flagellar basal-body rod modification protein FlgD
MTVSATTSTTATGTTSLAAASSNALQGTSDEFLKLFMAQLQNQDPINPQNSTDMVAQLAQFSSVEQQTQTNTQLGTLTQLQTSSANSNLASLVGRQCDANVGNITLTNASQVPPIEVSSTGSMTGATINITNSAGKVIRTLPIPANGGAVQWDGKDSSGNTAPAGAYNVAVSSGSTASAISATWQGNVNSVQLSASGSSLQMGGIQVQPGDITSIGATGVDALTTAITSATNTSTNAAITTTGAKA